MRRQVFFIRAFIGFIISTLPASATIINIPGDYPTIQQGIDASVDGDTVLVQPGTYAENINFNGHSIVLGSLFLTTGDTSYISSTVIDRGSPGSVVKIENGEDESTQLVGFKITNGTANDGGGIYCHSSSGTIRNNIIKENGIGGGFGYGGGIYSRNSRLLIKDNYISSNYANADEGTGGSAIFCRYDTGTVIINNTIVENTITSIWGSDGGAILIYSSDSITVMNNTISMNFGGGLKIGSSNVEVLNNIIRENTFYEIDISGGDVNVTYCDVRGGWPGEGNIGLDPLFVDFENGNYQVCAQSPCIDAGDPDILDPDGTRSDIGVFYYDHIECALGYRWYVATSGDDETGDGSLLNPFRTIQHALNRSFNSDTVIVESGTYSENIVIEDKSIVLTSNFTFSGDEVDIQNTIIDGGSVGSVLYLENCGSAMEIAGFTIGNGFSDYGAGLYCSYSPVTIRDNIISQNSAFSDGGGLYLSQSEAVIIHNIIDGNTAQVYGGGIECEDSDATIHNNVIYGNSAYSRGGGLSVNGSNPELTNNILWENAAPNNSQIYSWGSSFPVITFCDIQGGWGGEGNIDIDPLFRDSDNGDFHLMSIDCGDPYTSQCVDAGHPETLDSFLACSRGLGTIMSDIGAYGGGDRHRTIINIPADYPTIQQGIDASLDGDTVLVQPGTYYENINFSGHNIKLASLYFTTGDSSYISNTIIDGNSLYSVVKFDHGETDQASLIGFTIQNGQAAKGGGIACYESNPTISDNIIVDNTAYGSIPSAGYGGGIYVENSDPVISGNVIISNASINVHDWGRGLGGGIYCTGSSPVINGNIIMENICTYSGYSEYSTGGGIYGIDSHLLVSGNLIYANSAYSGAGIYCDNSVLEITGSTVAFNIGSGIACLNGSIITLLNSIVWGNHGTGGSQNLFIYQSPEPQVRYCDIGEGWEGEGNIDQNPLFLSPLNGNYNICSQSPCIDSGDPALQDPDGSRSDIGFFYPEHPGCFNGDKWHVSVSGDDEYGDGSESDPFRTIQHSLNVALHGDTIIVHNGTYVENVIFGGKILLLASEYYYSNDSLDIYDTIIDGNHDTSTVIFKYAEDTTSVIKGFTITNASATGICCLTSSPTIVNNRIVGNSGYLGGGISCRNRSNAIIRDNRIENNNCLLGGSSSGSGGGIFCYSHSIPRIENNYIVDNISANHGGGIACYYMSDAYISGNSIINNSTDYAGGGIKLFESDPRITNNIIGGNSGHMGGGINALHFEGILSGNIIHSNYAAVDGGGMWFGGNAVPELANNTFYGNEANRWGGAVYCYYGSPGFVNTIFWADSAPGGGREIYGPVTATYSDIAGGYEGQGNIDCDPEFCDPINGDFRLGDNSCCIGAGEGGVDIGALGAGCEPCAYTPGDCDHNGIPLELADVMAMIGMYRNMVEPFYTCYCPNHGSNFAPEADPNGNCVALELGDVVREIGAYRGSATAEGCIDCPGSLRIAPDKKEKPLIAPSLKAKAKISRSQTVE